MSNSRLAPLPGSSEIPDPPVRTAGKRAVCIRLKGFLVRTLVLFDRRVMGLSLIFLF